MSTSQNPADMSQVLKELQSGSIKLRSIPRSPGGTPIKQKQSPTISGSDPCAIIARALHSKFSHLRSIMDNSISDEEKNCQSNIHLDSGLGPGCEDIWSPKRKPNGSPHSLLGSGLLIIPDFVCGVSYVELLNRPVPLNPPDIEATPTNVPIDITPPKNEEIRIAIRQMKSGNALGPDNIPPETLNNPITSKTGQYAASEACSWAYKINKNKNELKWL
ncbi:unnamed protein product [Schistosoma mattheei]|uniref:Uncharacterized protein n=1 Tax=Schistosoma mattheei TaxID=31246 RepID=A0A3P8G5T3_9TREM|nr:unnamed protein product [Schistosoma mattheei]